MNKILLFVSSLLFLCSCQKEENKKTSLQNRINEAFNAVEGDFALAFLPLDTPENSIMINSREMFHAASTMKTPVMIEVFKQMDEGKISLNDSVLIKNTFSSIVDGSAYELAVSADSESNLYTMVGKKVLLEKLVYEMIIRSSNLATNLVIELVGAKNTTATMRKLGAPTIQVLRGVEDTKAYEQGLSNTTSAYDLMKIFEQLALETAAKPTSTKRMIEILLDQQFNELIPEHLPDEVKVAHKTGMITGVHHDSGIVFLPDGGKYVLVVLSKNLTDEAKGVATIAQVSKWIYDFYSTSNESQ